MVTVALSNINNLNFIRQFLLPLVTRPQAAIVIYPQNNRGTTLTINVGSNNIVITYISSSTSTSTISYLNVSVEDLCLLLNSSGLPIKAHPLINNTILKSGDLLSTSTAKKIPDAFPIYDRTTNNGILIRSKFFSIREKSTSQIRILDPYSESATLPWYPRLSVSSFSHKINNRLFLFSIPEFDNQTWSIKFGKPFKDIKGEIPIQVSDKSFRLRRTPIYWSSDNISIYRNNTPISASIIQDIDVNNGIVYFKNTVVNIDEITVDYSYKEETYEYKEVNLNCHFSQNPLLLNKYVLIYLLPSEGSGLDPNKNVVRHIIADSIEEAIDSIPVENSDIPIAIIGAYALQQVYASDKAKILDTRVKGGGLLEHDGPTSPVHILNKIIQDNNGQKIEDKYIESNSFWNIGKWDGELYPGSAAVLVDVPLELRKKFSTEDVRNKSTKFLAAGVYPLFEFSDRPLPDVTGWSTQISCAPSGIDISGNYILPTTYELPGGLLDSSWDQEFDRSLNVYSGDNTYILNVNSNSGFYIPYLKSSPIAGIEWKERHYLINSGSLSNPIEYTPWETKRIYDSRKVDNFTLLKGNLLFEPNHYGKQYKDIVINSPFPNHGSRTLKTKLSNLFEEITDSILEYKTDVPYSGISTTISSLSSYDTTNVSNYIGMHPAYRYILELSKTDLSGIYNPIVDQIVTYYSSSLKASGEFIRQFNVNSGHYIDYTENQNNLVISEPIKDLSNLIENRKNRYGTSDIIYMLGTGILYSFVSQLYQSTIDSNSIINSSSEEVEVTFIPTWPYYWNYNVASGSYSGIPIRKPENEGYQFSEISDFNQDHLINETPACVVGISKTSSNITGSINNSISGALAGALYVSTQNINRLRLSINQAPTYSGLSLVNSWFTTHDRLGEYAGNTVKNFIYAYENLKQAYSGITPTSLIGITGMDLHALNSYFNMTSDALNLCYNKVKQSIERGAIIQPEMLYLIHGYGWYCANRSGHYNIYTGTQDSNYTSTFYPLYNKGIDVYLNSMITTEGLAIESTYIDYAPGPYSGNIPNLIFNAMIPGISLDRQNYINKITALFNTVTGLYYKDGFFYSDPRKISDAPGAEEPLSLTLAKIYKEL